MTYRETIVSQNNLRCHNTEKADIRFGDGGLRHAVGACNYQIVRSAKNTALSPEGRGWTYNHASMLVYWKEHFLVEYLAGPAGEHEPPSAVFLCRSANGRDWNSPKELFPPASVSKAPYKGPGKELIQGEETPCIVHHRMGFFVTADGRLLASTFYGISPNCHISPNNGYGVGRVVREIREDFSFGPIFFLKYNLPGGYNRNNTSHFPFYLESEDKGFVEACNEFLSHRLATLQWQEEECFDESFTLPRGGKAFGWYTLPGGDVMGFFKNAMTSLSRDGGETWSELEKAYSIETSTGKMWGQKTGDGRYALVYNPTTDSAHRWPLAVVTGDNGVDFDNLLTITPEVSPCRYEGKLKNLGPQYVRGITENNPQPEDGALWLTYSVNKEDIWVCRVPVPITGQETENVREDFSASAPEGPAEGWNLYVPKWGEARVKAYPSDNDKSLYLTDWDPYNRVLAERMFAPGVLIKAEFRLMVKKPEGEKSVAVFLQDRHGAAPVSLLFSSDGGLYLRSGGLNKRICACACEAWLDVSVTADCVKNRVVVTVSSEAETTEKSFDFAQSVHMLERIVFTTKYTLPFQDLEINGRNGDIGILPQADAPHAKTECYINTLRVDTLEKE